MNYAIIRYILSNLILFEGGFLLMPGLVSLIYHEEQGIYYFAVAAACFVIGAIGRFREPENKAYFAKEGLVIVSLGWFLLGLIGALPFRLSGEIPVYIDAVFETISGFTTTGSSILIDIEALSHTALFWRSFTHWMGGMGVLVLLMAVLNLSGSYNVFLMRAESPGPDADKITPKVKNSAMILYKIYIVITLAEMISLKIAGLSLFEASTLTFSTVGTGGFAPLSSSIASYSPTVQTIFIVFMLICGVNFSVYFLLIQKRFKEAVTFEEMWHFLAIVFIAAVLITVNIHGMFESLGEAFRTALFQVASIISTTGFVTADFNLWPQFSKTILLTVMMIGACAGSTGGGMKVSRVMILFRNMRIGIKQASHPRNVYKVHLNGKMVNDDTVWRVSRFFIIYAIIIGLSFLVVSLDGFDTETSLTAVLTTLNNVGPGLGMVGATGNFAAFSPLAKSVLIFDMIAGRLELLPVLTMFTPGIWKRFN